MAHSLEIIRQHIKVAETTNNKGLALRWSSPLTITACCTLAMFRCAAGRWMPTAVCRHSAGCKVAKRSVATSPSFAGKLSKRGIEHET
jgi:hypothetical protein